MGVRIRINSNQFLKEAKSAVDNLTRERFRECGPEIGEEFVQICTPFVPWKTGTLAGSGGANMEGDGIRVHWAEVKDGFDVAEEQYNVPHNHPVQGTDHWDKAAMAYEGETFRTRCEQILNGK